MSETSTPDGDLNETVSDTSKDNMESGMNKPLNKFNQDRGKKRYCICQEEYQDGKIMIFCEGPCGDWYHPKCLGIPDLQTKALMASKEPWYCKVCAVPGEQQE
jgi:hypothetical protein